MHPTESTERPSPAIAVPASSPAPADAGQGVGTLAQRAREYLLRADTHLRAAQVLTDMVGAKFKVGDFDSDECIALTLALIALTDRIEERGYRS